MNIIYEACITPYFIQYKGHVLRKERSITRLHKKKKKRAHSHLTKQQK